MAEKKAAPAQPAMPPPEPEASMRAKIADLPVSAATDNLRKDQIVAGVPPPPPAPAAAAPVLMARKAEVDATTGQPAAATFGTLKKKEDVPDARAIFYANQPAPAANAFVSPGGGGGAAPPAASQAASKRDGLARLGVRVSILRGTSEVDPATVLHPGETVRLRLIPNADGFLYVVEGSRTVASGAAQRLRPFETPELRFEGSGPRQLYVMLSQRPQSADPRSLGSLAGDNLTGTSEGATFAVSGTRDAGAPQVVVRVTLTYR